MMRLARFHGALVAALFASAVGLYVGNYAFFLLAVVPLAYVVAGHATGLGPPSLRVERELSDDRTDPGVPVTVRVTVENVGERPIPDLRIVDGVPDDVPVVDGAPAGCVALRPGESATVEYDVLPPRGNHEFGAVTARGRSLTGTVVGTTDVAVEGDTHVVCDTVLDEFPLADETTLFPGRHPTDAGGRGVEFHSVRSYRRGDAMSRIDWRRLARTGELTTINLREERSTSVVFVVDTREAARLVPNRGGPSSTDLCTYAAAQGFVTLTEAGHEVGVTTLTPRETRDWVTPGRDEATRVAANDVFDSVRDDRRGDTAGGTPPGRSSTDTVAGDGTPGAEPTGDGPPDSDGASDGTPPDGGDDSSAVAPDGGDDAGSSSSSPGTDAAAATPDGAALALRLCERLPDRTQVVLCTPLVDDVPVEVVESLLARHHPVTVVSPDVTVVPGTNPSPGQAVADLARRRRLAEIHRLGVPASDWSPDTPLGTALATVFEHRGWAR